MYPSEFALDRNEHVQLNIRVRPLEYPLDILTLYPLSGRTECRVRPSSRRGRLARPRARVGHDTSLEVQSHGGQPLRRRCRVGDQRCPSTGDPELTSLNLTRTLPVTI